MKQVLFYAVAAVIGVALIALLFKVLALIVKALLPVIIILAAIFVAVKFVLNKEEA